MYDQFILIDMDLGWQNILTRLHENYHITIDALPLDNSMFSEIYFNYNILIEFRLHI